MQHTVTLNITAGQIDSFREVERTTGTVRVYENGCIGVAGCLGEPNEEELTEKAKERHMRVKDQIEQFHKELEEGISPAEKKQFLEILDRIRANLESGK